ncbi:bifunctional glycosyltransferase family 2 protein/CDP-glycerol:glycerophosphate glycerophosphotransferase [uncultured Methanobrevibacter sp.]|uniref:bifunctional glycosyltransferase/CDP-glycerol:glycerophosphate glycerophosphotransferase n=1 Tax=uncultured Methanobrevibacter sp. TaxID=253161 RepID=UPI0026327018|nr:bifunctional glycosyltransferase family 2 protein/CDP-glycerol:glycerophosphate glycerophosphotransferase [uncultured Methanobrevibacter sp.]
MKTRISVIIPIYNVHEFLEECIDSVLAQTINDLELTDGYERNLQIILIDDGSTDDTADIAKGYVDRYENIEYHYEENQGLGHARNYGCEFAVGDYIIFLDSDDVISPNAYEWMYTAAVKNGSDMTIGNVWRFNSKGTMMSNIHQTAFNVKKEVTHITESPELFYDTTAWNKLIKRSFWHKHGFKFPEGILYEDIPVTMPMHFLANNVSIVHENCYLWRIREGKSKSITQTTAETKNLTDRLSVMRMVDKFFDENVADEHLHHVKTMKWLKIDLKIFINKLKSLREDESQEIIRMLQEYINENIDRKEFQNLNEFDELEYEYLMEGDFKKLYDVLNFEFDTLKVTKVYQKGGHVMFDADKNLFKKSPFTIDRYVRENVNFKYLQEVKFGEENVEIRGFCVIPGLNIDNYSDREYSFELVNAKSRKRIPLEYEDVETGSLTSFDIRFGRRFSYKKAGYKINIPYSKFYNNPDFTGENRIMVSFTQQGINHNFFAGSAKVNVRDASDMQARIYENTYFRFKYTLKNEIIIEIFPLKRSYDKVTVENGNLCIHSPQFNGDLFVYYPEDSLNCEVKMKFDWDGENSIYSIGIDQLRNIKGKIIYDDGETAVYTSKDLLAFATPQGQVIIDPSKDYYMDIYKYENTTLVSDVKQNGGRFEITARLMSKQSADLQSAKLYFKDALNLQKYHVSDAKVSGDTLKFNLDLSDKRVTKNLYKGMHDLYVGYDGFETPLHIAFDYNETYQKGLYDYIVHREDESRLRVKTIRNWPIYEDTPGKRLKHSKLTYRAFLKLPINNKRIIFESMWGSKYSCNPRYLYEFINENYPDWDCIWVLGDEHIPINGSGKRVRRFSVKYFYYLATSKFFVNNVNFHEHYVKRPGQIEIQTMHGTPLKTLGLDVPGDFPTKKREEEFIEKCSHWDYLTVQSDFVAEISERCFLFKKEFLKYGYPRTDILYTKNNEDDIKKLKEKMGIPMDKKVILYAPTWRLKNKFDMMLDLESLKKSLSDEYVLILRLHHFSAEGWKQPPEDDFVYDLTDYDSVEEIYLISDIMITDYSSVMFDYAILGRPIILFAFDLAEYREKLRGLYVDIEDNTPGPILYTSKEVEDAILNIEETKAQSKDLMDRFCEKFIQYECENSSEKIFDEVMKKHGNEGILNKVLRKIMP